MTSDPFAVVVTRAAAQDIVSVPSLRSRIAKALLTLERRPDRGHSLAGSLLGLVMK